MSTLAANELEASRHPRAVDARAPRPEKKESPSDERRIRDAR
jgi:hypothetical protein